MPLFSNVEHAFHLWILRWKCSGCRQGILKTVSRTEQGFLTTTIVMSGLNKIQEEPVLGLINMSLALMYGWVL
ncbi:hypothetical protein NQ318_016292 [Aromia moschata]|uniref:Uncharacterized protein n=1 Tax=Aromia moschata TaxID=1265417 RepID=A0AAV8XX64_9CUCU|nr:hypothetical protein NQ318_016292 [Aromia moschata]